MLWIAVGVGGALGSLARHGVNVVVHQRWSVLRFPVGTVIVNVTGCCIIGLLAGLVISGRLPLRLYWREFVFVGLLGGFTTFSTFGLDTIVLVRSGDITQAIANILLQVLGGLGGVYICLVIAERVGRGLH
jgi:CrcB protein